MAVDTLSRRALLEAKRDNDYAPRHKVWPPTGYVAPTAEEFAELRARLSNKSVYVITRGAWERWPDEKIIREAHLLTIAPYREWNLETAAYAWSHTLRNEMNRRKLKAAPPLAVLRCESCSHATERLFEATQETHPGMENRRGPVASAFYCARCWSGYTLGDLADGLADDDETEDE